MQSCSHLSSDVNLTRTHVGIPHWVGQHTFVCQCCNLGSEDILTGNLQTEKSSVTLVVRVSIPIICAFIYSIVS